VSRDLPAPDVPTAPSGPDADLAAEVAARIGSTREAAWIVEHVDAGRAGGGGDAAARRGAALALADRRAAGEPLQYVLGSWQFRTLELTVDRRVLIPRPETEQVVEVALDELARVAATRTDDGTVVAVDLGTGSGAIALSLAVEGAVRAAPARLEVWATDRSSDALDVARANLAALAAVDPEAAGRVTTAEGSWFDALAGGPVGPLDLVVANPPYVAEEEYDGLDPTVRAWEPLAALVAARGASGVAGMADVEAVVAGAARRLRPGGALVVELAPSQAYGAIDVARRAGFTRVGTARDLAGRLRMLVAGR
jgi:release factor glutamine methyltransferase